MGKKKDRLDKATKECTTPNEIERAISDEAMECIEIKEQATETKENVVVIRNLKDLIKAEEIEDVELNTKYGRYTPTLLERKLLFVLTELGAVKLSITDICIKAGVKRDVYYKAMAKPGFKEYFNGMMRDNLSGKVAGILNASYRFAVSNPKNFQDRKLLLEMAGAYIETQKVQHTGDNGEPIRVIFDIPRPPREEQHD